MAGDEGLLRQVADRSPDGLWITDRGGAELYCNATAARFVGEVGADGELDHEAMDTLRRLRETALASGSATDDLCSTTPDGDLCWVRAYVAVHEREDGGEDVVVHRFNDITADRRLRHDLAESRRRLAAAQELTGASGWIWDLATDRIAMPVLDEEDPSGPERLVDITSYADWLASLVPEHRATVEQATAAALGGGDLYDVVFATHDTAGTPVWVHAHGVVEREDGVAVRVHGTFQDVTQIHEAEAELLRQVERTALLRRVTAAANEHRTFAEAAAAIREVLLGSARCERMTVLALRGESLEPFDQQPTAEELRLAQLALGPEPFVWSEDRRLLAFAARHEDVTAGVVVVTWVPGLDRFTTTASAAAAVGAVLGRVAERERAEVVIERARDAAMAASRQKSEFLATMSHEVRTPLNGIIGLNELLLRTTLDPDQLRLASGVQAASRTLLGLVDDVLDFSRIEEGHLRIESVDFEVRPLLDALARTMAASVQERGIDLWLVCDDDVPPALTGDPHRLSQVLVNLVTNAVKFTEEGQVVVRVTTAGPTASGRVPLRLEVVDTGIGVDPALVPHLFEPFRQGDASTTRRYGGTGLGLAIVHRTVTALAGEVAYAPRAAGGSSFVVDLRLGVSHVGAGALDEYARTWLTGRRVLVVADDEAGRDHADRQLSWWRLRVTPAGPGDALGALQDGLDRGDPFEAVVVCLPAVATLDLARAVAAVRQLDGVVLLALVAPGTDADALQELGVSVTLSRPVPSDVLRAQLLEHLAGVAPQPQERAVVPRRRRQRRLLVVEDNPVNQLVATGLLESLGFDVEVAGDGAVALELLERASYDAVLMDVQMPVLDGYETTRRLRAAGRTLPVVAMTASAVEGERERCLAAGMDDFLTKPVDPVDLAGALERWLGVTHGGPHEEPAPPPSEPAPLPPTPPIAGLDVERLDMLRDMDPDDTSYLERAIGNFEANSVTAVETIGRLVAEGDVAAVRSAAHKIAGSALNLGATRAGEAARAVEQLADTGTVDGADELLGELSEAMSEARGLLGTYRATLTG